MLFDCSKRLAGLLQTQPHQSLRTKAGKPQTKDAAAEHDWPENVHLLF